MTTQQTDIDKALVALLVDDICSDIHDNVIKKVTKKYVHKAIMLVREKQHTVYAVCPECEDYYYGFNEPEEIFFSLEEAKQYVIDMLKGHMTDIEEPIFEEDDYYGIRVIGGVYDYIIKKYIVK